jgi:hypothetical protein
MSFEPDNTEAESTISRQNEEIICLLKALLVGMEIITDTVNLREQIED